MNQVFLEYWDLPRELKLLLDISLRQTEKVPDGLDWDYFDSLLSQHRIQPLLIRGLRPMGGECPRELAKYRPQQTPQGYHRKNQPAPQQIKGRQGHNIGQAQFDTRQRDQQLQWDKSLCVG